MWLRGSGVVWVTDPPLIECIRGDIYAVAQRFLTPNNVQWRKIDIMLGQYISGQITGAVNNQGDMVFAHCVFPLC